MTRTLAALGCTLIALTSHAQVTRLGITTTNQTLTTGQEVVVNALSIDFAGQYTGSQLLVNLTSGSIYQDALGSALPPNPGFIAVFPNLAFDTFLAQGSLTAGSDAGEPAPGGGAVGLGGAAAAVFTANAINQAWNPSGGQTGTTDRTGFYVAQVTFTPDTHGSFSYLGTAGGKRYVTELPDLHIFNGRIQPIFGDVNGNGSVGQSDLDLVLLNWGRDIDAQGVPAGWNVFPPTGLVSQNELDLVLLHWRPGASGAGHEPAGAAVPEPATAAAWVGLLLLRRRR